MLFSPISPLARRTPAASVSPATATPPGASNASRLLEPWDDTTPAAAAAPPTTMHYIFDNRGAALLRTSYIYLMLDADSFGNSFISTSDSPGYGQVCALRAALSPLLLQWCA